MRAEAARSAPHEMRLAGRLALGAALAAALAAPFLGMLLLMEGRYEGLEELDRRFADALNSWALQHPGVVDLLTFLQAALSPNTFRLLVLLVAVGLWRAGSRRRPIWGAVTTGLGALLGVVLKRLVHRARPSFPDPVAAAGSYSFPSAHALGSFLGTGVLLLVALPVLSGSARAVAVGVVTITGINRIALGVRFFSDVLAGWFAAGALPAGTATVFVAWRGARRPTDGLDPVDSRRLLRGRRS